MESFDFDSTSFFKNQKALIDPGYPFIAMPEAVFDEFAN